MTPHRSRHRAPARLFGWTKGQALDLVVRNNTRTCLFVIFLAFPAMAFGTWRYQTVLKPVKQEWEKKRAEELLSEGRPNTQ